MKSLRDSETPRVCWDATVLFHSPIQISLFLRFQNREKAIFTAETVAQRNGPIFTKQAPNHLEPVLPTVLGRTADTTG